ncbi:MAG: ABC-type transport auxiliary lipoprotein family protein [Deltaproteobacteria bacterium]|nr:ABC-type transport auxiliary lipoprotein family protein [Deltaproteobacteria bacterium]
MKRAVLTTVVLAVTLSAGGCFNIQREHKEVFYYQLEYDPPRLDVSPHKDVVVRVSNFNVAPSYQSQKILYSTSTLKRKMYDYHLWVVNPGDMLTDLIMRDLISSGVYQAVVDMRSSVNPNYELEGIVERIYEKDHEDTWNSVLYLRCVFFSYHGGKHVLFQKEYQEAVPAATRDPNAVVAAMSEAARRVSRRVQVDALRRRHRLRNLQSRAAAGIAVVLPRRRLRLLRQDLRSAFSRGRTRGSCATRAR